MNGLRSIKMFPILAMKYSVLMLGTMFTVIHTCAATSGFGPSSSSLLANDAAVLKFLS